MEEMRNVSTASREQLRQAEPQVKQRGGATVVTDVRQGYMPLAGVG